MLVWGYPVLSHRITSGPPVHCDKKGESRSLLDELRMCHLAGNAEALQGFFDRKGVN
jgi:hypothetical protein